MTVTTTTTTIAKNGTFVMQKWEENANHHQLLRRATESRKNTRKTNTYKMRGENKNTKRGVNRMHTGRSTRNTVGKSSENSRGGGNGGQ